MSPSIHFRLRGSLFPIACELSLQLTARSGGHTLAVVRDVPLRSTIASRVGGLSTGIFVSHSFDKMAPMVL